MSRSAGENRNGYSSRLRPQPSAKRVTNILTPQNRIPSRTPRLPKPPLSSETFLQILDPTPDVLASSTAWKKHIDRLNGVALLYQLDLTNSLPCISKCVRIYFGGAGQSHLIPSIFIGTSQVPSAYVETVLGQQHLTSITDLMKLLEHLNVAVLETEEDETAPADSNITVTWPANMIHTAGEPYSLSSHDNVDLNHDMENDSTGALPTMVGNAALQGASSDKKKTRFTLTVDASRLSNNLDSVGEHSRNREASEENPLDSLMFPYGGDRYGESARGEGYTKKGDTGTGKKRSRKRRRQQPAAISQVEDEYSAESALEEMRNLADAQFSSDIQGETGTQSQNFTEEQHHFIIVTRFQLENEFRKSKAKKMFWTKILMLMKEQWPELPHSDVQVKKRFENSCNQFHREKRKVMEQGSTNWPYYTLFENFWDKTTTDEGEEPAAEDDANNSGNMDVVDVDEAD